MGVISRALNIRNKQRYKHRKKLPALLFILLIFMPTHSVYSKDGKCIFGSYQYQNMLYDMVSKRIKEPRPSGMCSIMFDIDLHEAAIVGNVTYLNSPLCRLIMPIFSDISKHKLAKCYVETGVISNDGRRSYVLVFGDGKH